MAKIRFPKKVEIGGFDVKVEYPSIYRDNESLSGNFNSATMSVKILEDPDIDDQVVVETFFHEFVHAVDYIYLGLVLSEDMTDSIARGLLSIFRFNDLDFLNITAYNMPESVMIGSSIYKIAFPYKFIDTGFENTVSYVPSNKCEIRLTDALHNFDVDDQVLRAGLIIGMVYAIIDEFHGSSEDRLPEGILAPLSNGLYQFIRNAKVEERITKWLKN